MKNVFTALLASFLLVALNNHAFCSTAEEPQQQNNMIQPDSKHPQQLSQAALLKDLLKQRWKGVATCIAGLATAIIFVDWCLQGSKDEESNDNDKIPHYLTEYEVTNLVCCSEYRERELKESIKYQEDPENGPFRSESASSVRSLEFTDEIENDPYVISFKKLLAELGEVYESRNSMPKQAYLVKISTIEKQLDVIEWLIINRHVMAKRKKMLGQRESELNEKKQELDALEAQLAAQEE